MTDDVKSASAQSETSGSGAEHPSSQLPEKLALEVVDVGSATNTPVTRYGEESTTLASDSPMIGVIAGNHHSCYDLGGCPPFDQPTPTPQGEAKPVAGGVRCNQCGWKGDEADLIATRCGADGEPCRGCPDCKTDHGLIDIETESDFVHASTAPEACDLIVRNAAIGKAEAVGFLSVDELRDTQGFTSTAPETELGATDKWGDITNGPGTRYDIRKGNNTRAIDSVITDMRYADEVITALRTLPAPVSAGTVKPLADAVAAARELVACRCDPAFKDRGLHDPQCNCDYSEEIEALILSAIETPVSAWQGAKARPLAEWHEDMGDVVWWKFPVEEPAFIGSPLGDDWPGYHTHFTPHPDTPAPPSDAKGV